MKRNACIEHVAGGSADRHSKASIARPTISHEKERRTRMRRDPAVMAGCRAKGVWAQLMEAIEYEEHYFSTKKKSVFTRPGRKRIDAHWPLDVPEVEMLSYEQLSRLEMPGPTRERVREVISWNTDENAFKRLFKTFPRISLAGESDEFQEEVTRLEKLKYITPITRSKVKGFVKGFTVPKPKKKTRRTILDGRKLNEQQQDPPQTKLPGLTEIEECVRAFPLGLEMDGKGWYHQFGLSPEIAAYWVLRVAGKRYTWNRMPMGWTHSVYAANTVTEALAAFDWGSCRLLVYIDNVYVFGKSESDIMRVTDEFMVRCRKINASFEITTPVGEEMNVLGVRVNLAQKTLDIQPSTRDNLKMFHDCMEEIWWKKGTSRCTPSTRQIWKVFGNITWAARILKHKLCDYPSWLSWLSRRARQITSDVEMWEKPCGMWASAQRDLRRLVKNLIQASPRAVKIELDESVELYTDASDVGWGVVSFAEDDTEMVQHRRWSDTMRRKIIAERELDALVRGVHHVVTTRPEVRAIRVYCDNQNVCAWVSKGRARSFFGNVKLQQLELDIKHLQLQVVWVPSAENLADRPSRF